jgi:hypothetical protein
MFKEQLDFIKFVRWRSLIAYMLLAVIYFEPPKFVILIVAVIATIHQWFIFKHDRGVTHKSLFEKINKLEQEKRLLQQSNLDYQKTSTENQETIIKLLEKI